MRMRQLGRGAGVEGGLVLSFNQDDDDDDDGDDDDRVEDGLTMQMIITTRRKDDDDSVQRLDRVMIEMIIIATKMITMTSSKTFTIEPTKYL